MNAMTELGYGPVRFRFGRKHQVTLYRDTREDAGRVSLTAAAYALYHREHDQWVFDHRGRFKHPGNLVALDLEREPEFWIIVGPCTWDRLEYTCRHVHAPVVWVFEHASLDETIRQVRRAVHYRYTTGHLTLVAFHEPVEDWIDPSDVQVDPERFSIHSF
jgi:hypothetical protein